MDVLKIISYIGFIILIVNTVIYSIGFIKNDKAYKFFVFYLVAITIIQIVMEIYAGNGLKNHFLSNYYLFSQFILLSYFFYFLFQDSKRKKRLIHYATLFITLCLLVQYFLYPGLYFTFNSLGFLVTTSVLIIYAVMYLYELLTKRPSFVFTTVGLAIYLMSSSLIFVSASSIVSFNDSANMSIWKINALLFIIYQLLILWEWKRAFYLKAR